MTYKIRPKRSNVPSKVPLASDLELGELAINMADQKIYTKTPSNAIVELGGGSSTIDLLAVPSDIIPDGDLTRSLGSPDHQWADLYVGNATIYLNNVPLGLDGDLQLTFNGNVIANSDGAVQVDWTNISNVPGGYDPGNITFNGDQISSTGEGVDVSSSGYAQISSNNNYVWVDNSGAHVEIYNGEGSAEFLFQWNDGAPLLQLPSGADIVDSNGNSVLGGSGGNPFDQSLNTDSEVTFSSVFLGNNITSNGMEIVTLSGSGGSIDIYTDWGNGSGGVEVWLQHGEQVSIKTDDGNYAWIFDNTGNLTLPAGGDILDSTGNSVLGGGSGTTLPADAAGFLQNDGTGILSWASAPARLVSPNGDFEVTLDDTGALVLSSYGVVKNPDHVNMVSDGWVQMQWVDTNTLENADPNSTTGPTNWIYVDQYGIHVETNINSNIDDSTTRYNWNFDIYGKLQMPAGGDIVDSNGTSVLGGSSQGDISVVRAQRAAGGNQSTPGKWTFTTVSGSVSAEWVANGQTAYPALGLISSPYIIFTLNGFTQFPSQAYRLGVTGSSPGFTTLDLPTETITNKTSPNVLTSFDSSLHKYAFVEGSSIAEDRYYYFESGGAVGNDGAPGQGVPTGGTAGQVLAKIDGDDYNTEWVTPSGGNPFNQDLNTSDNVNFAQVRTARLEQGRNNVTKTSGYQRVEPGQTTDIWTSDNVEITSAKFTVQFETKTADPYYASFDTMTCEIVMAKKRDNGTWTDAPITVYAMVHTSEAPLATFSSYINGDGNAVLTCTPADSISARSYLKVQSVEMQSPSIQNDWC